LKKQLVFFIFDAFVDGATYSLILTRIFLPVAAPGLIEAILFVFTVSRARLSFALSFICRAEETCLTKGIHMAREKRRTGHHRRVESGFVDCIEFGGKLWQK